MAIARSASETRAFDALPVRWHQGAVALGQWARKIADWFIPDSLLLDTDTHHRALMFLTSHLLGPWLGFTVIGYLYLVDPTAGMVLWAPAAAIAAFLLFPFILRGTGQLNLLALVSVENVAFIVLYLSYFYGGMSSPFLPWLITVPLLAFFYLGAERRLRNITLAAFVGDIVIFYAVLHAADPASRVPLEQLSTVGLVSLLCAGLYVTMMAFYYARIVNAHSELAREADRHKQTAVMLAAARDAAEAANRAKSEFLATMSHELRTPLNAVIGFSEIMVRESFGPLGDARYKEYANDIQDSGSHLLQIINDILDISKAQTGTFELEETLVDCEELINSACLLLRPHIDKANHSLELSIAQPLPQLRADARMCKQMLVNLLSNAIKFSSDGSDIAIEAVADLRQGLTIAIRDDGIGIPARDLERVRKPFEQAESALNRRHEGTGLGLPLVDLMMAEHGGTLDLESIEGLGTIARLRFPSERLIWSSGHEPRASDTAQSPPRIAPSPSIPAPATAGGFAVPTVLVVDDNEDLRLLLERMLERAGFRTVGASDGRAAFQYLETASVDLVITDMVMPRMDGVELLRLLREAKPDLPVIALSGVDDFFEYRRIATHLGARNALQKPVSQADLTAAVNNVLAPQSKVA